MNKRYVTIGAISVVLALIATIIFYSSGGISEINLFSNTIELEPSNTIFNETDGSIIVLNSSGDPAAVHTLIKNTGQCLINCYAIIETTLFEPGMLAEDIEFRNKVGGTKEINDFKYFLNKSDGYDIEVDDYSEVCGNDNGTAYCRQEVSGSHTEEVTTYDYQRYTGKVLPAGTYQWKIEGRKDPKESLDWVITSFGETLDEWAWWNSTWGNKREIQIREETGLSQTHYPVRLNITYTSEINSSWKDVRFVDTNELIELDYYLWNTTSDYALIDVELNLIGGANTTIYIYYNNPAASTTSSGTDTYTYFKDFSSDTLGAVPSGWTDRQTTGQVTVQGDSGQAYVGTKYFQINDTSGALGYAAGRQEPVVYHQGRYMFWYKQVSGAGTPDSIGWATDFAGDQCWNNALATTSTYTEVRYEFNSSNVWRKVADNVPGAFGATGQTSCSSISLESFGGDVAQTYYGVLALANYTFPEPVLSIGSQQLISAAITTLVLPANNTNSTVNWVEFTWNSNSTGNNLTNTTFYLWNSTLDLVNSTFFEVSGLQNQTTLNLTSIPQESYVWNAESSNGEESVMGTNRTLEVHLTPVDMMINYPTGRINYLNSGDSVVFNWSILEGSTNLSEHVSNCSYTYNNTRTELSIATCVVTNATTFTYASGVNNISFNVTDEFNFQTINTSIWVVAIQQFDSNFSYITTEANTESFVIEVETDPSLVVSAANLIYNGTSKVATVSSLGSNRYNSNASKVIPGVAGNTNVSFYWNFVLNDSTQVNSTSDNQTITNIGADDCSTYGNNTLVYNFTVRAEETQVILDAAAENLSVDIDFDLYSLDRSAQVIDFSGNFSAVNPITICLNVNLTDSTKYSADTQVRYEGTQYEAEFYNIQNYTLQNSTANQSISLYDILSVDSTNFLITFKDTTFLPVSEALIQISRKYVGEGAFKTVEIPKTDADGQAVAHLDTDSVLYTLVVTKFGKILATFDNVAVICEDVVIGDCKINLNAVSTSTSFPTWETVGGASVAQGFDEDTRTITTTVSTNDGTARTFFINATKYDRLGNTTVCSQQLITASGSLSCVIPTSFGNTTVISRLSLDGSVVRTDSYSINPDPEEVFGGGVYVLAFILILTFPLMFIGSYIGVLIGGILGLIIAGVLVFMNTGGSLGEASAIIWFIVAIGIVIWKISQSRDGI